MEEKRKYKVYLVATPIGNLSEITLRALEILKSVDIIYCEDTRHSALLLSHYSIGAKLVSYHKFNEKSRVEDIIEAVTSGKTVAVITDAGMPAISDPGAILTRELIKNDISYSVVSGACAFVNAFVLSGLEAPFTFAGFLPEKKKRRDEMLDSLGNNVLIFYCSPYKINEDLSYLYEKLGNRKAAIIKEISKLHESVVFCGLKDARAEDPRGEYVVVVDRGDSKPEYDIDSVYERFILQGMSKKDAIQSTAALTGVSKNEIYSYFINKSEPET